jgi:hypothetical protein
MHTLSEIALQEAARKRARREELQKQQAERQAQNQRGQQQDMDQRRQHRGLDCALDELIKVRPSPSCGCMHSSEEPKVFRTTSPDALILRFPFAPCCDAFSITPGCATGRRGNL